MMTITFGIHKLCTDCGKRDRRGNPYATGWKWWPKRTLLPNMIVVGYDRTGNYAKIECQTCQGTGVIVA